MLFFKFNHLQRFCDFELLALKSLTAINIELQSQKVAYTELLIHRFLRAILFTFVSSK